MTVQSEIETQVAGIFRGVWAERKGYVVPDAASLKLANDGVTYSVMLSLLFWVVALGLFSATHGQVIH